MLRLTHTEEVPLLVERTPKKTNTSKETHEAPRGWMATEVHRTSTSDDAHPLWL